MAAYLGHHNLPKVVGGDATHVVVHRGQHGDRLLGHVHTSENRSGLGDARQALVQHLRGQVVQVQVDVVLRAGGGHRLGAQNQSIMYEGRRGCAAA